MKIFRLCIVSFFSLLFLHLVAMENVERNTSISCAEFKQFMPHLSPWRNISDEQAAAELELFINETNADVNVMDDNGQTPLLYATQGNNLAAVKALLRAGADVNKGRMSSGFSPLLLACCKDKKIFHALLHAQNVDVNIQDYSGTTALMVVTKKGYVEQIKMLLRAGASVDIMDCKHYTALNMTQNEQTRALLNDAACAERRVAREMQKIAQKTARIQVMRQFRLGKKDPKSIVYKLPPPIINEIHEQLKTIDEAEIF
jgi:hypothetical protein